MTAAEVMIIMNKKGYENRDAFLQNIVVAFYELISKDIDRKIHLYKDGIDFFNCVKEEKPQLTFTIVSQKIHAIFHEMVDDDNGTKDGITMYQFFGLGSPMFISSLLPYLLVLSNELDIHLRKESNDETKFLQNYSIISDLEFILVCYKAEFIDTVILVFLSQVESNVIKIIDVEAANNQIENIYPLVSDKIKDDYIIEFNAIRSSKDTSDIAKLMNIIHESDNLCSKCEFKKSDACETCLLVLDSPLERKLFLELKKAKISFQPQYALDRNGNQISIDGKSYLDAKNNFKNVLTIVDFYIERKGVRFCVYTDGHTYHERTPEQAQRDRNIDRKLQEFGFKVLRYTGKEVNEDSAKIVSDILDWKKNKNHDGFDADDLPF